MSKNVIVTEDTAAVTAHWLLGRLSALQGMLRHVADRDDLGRDTRVELVMRSNLVADQMRQALEAMARGHDAPLVDLTDQIITNQRD